MWIAFDLAECQLLEADLIKSDDTELGDMESVTKKTDGDPTELLIEVDDSNLDCSVTISIEGLEPIGRGNNTDLS